MTAKFVLTDGHKSSYLELEESSNGWTTQRDWRQKPPFTRSLLETLSGTWSLGEAPTELVNDRFAVRSGPPPLILSNGEGRAIMQFARKPNVSANEAVNGLILRPDGTKEHAILATMGQQTDPGKWWFGVGVKIGGAAGLVGCELMVAVIYNFSLGVFTPILATSSRVGLGLGASGGVVVVGVYGFPDAHSLVGQTFGGLDFALALEERWSGWLKAVRVTDPKMLTGMARAMQALGTVRCSQVRGLDQLMSIASKFCHSEGAINWAKNIVGLSNYSDQNSSIGTIDVPGLSKGVELGIYNCDGKIVAVGERSLSGYAINWAPPDPTPSKPMREPHFGGGNRSAY